MLFQSLQFIETIKNWFHESQTSKYTDDSREEQELQSLKTILTMQQGITAFTVHKDPRKQGVCCHSSVYEWAYFYSFQALDETIFFLLLTSSEL